MRMSARYDRNTFPKLLNKKVNKTAVKYFKNFQVPPEIIANWMLETNVPATPVNTKPHAKTLSAITIAFALLLGRGKIVTFTI